MNRKKWLHQFPGLDLEDRAKINIGISMVI